MFLLKKIWKKLPDKCTTRELRDILRIYRINHKEFDDFFNWAKWNGFRFELNNRIFKKIK